MIFSATFVYSWKKLCVWSTGMVGRCEDGADDNVPLPGHAVGVEEADVGEVVGVVGIAPVVSEAHQQLSLGDAQLVDRLVKPFYC